MIVPSDFAPPFWLRGPHLQTLWPYLFHARRRVPVRRERLELDDGDFIDLDWNTQPHGPIVVVLHGLSGSIKSHYAHGLLHRLQRRGMRAVVMNFRGAGGQPNRLARGYHAGETGDLETVIAALRRREPGTPLAAVGFSLGGNVLLKWLGERGGGAPLRAAVAVSVPFDLALAVQRLNRGLSRLYQWHILRSLKADLAAKAKAVPLPIDVARAAGVRDFRAFDDVVTAPLHGFAGAQEYYAQSSARRYLHGIQVPTLIVQARDDPFLPACALPDESELSPAVRLELSGRGGHVGFVGGRGPRDWLQRRIADYLRRLSSE